MGLTIHYRLRSDAPNPETVRELLTRLRGRALDLPLERVGAILELAGDACDYERRGDDDPHRWLLIQASQHVELRAGGGLHTSYRVPPTHLVAFFTAPGKGCEPANFGLCRYPAHIDVPDPRRPDAMKRVATQFGQGWHWSSFCKTQYASKPECGGVPHFLRCHLSVIRVLDFAQKLGLVEDVSDEGGFWDMRDMPALARAVGGWNTQVAREVGRWRNLLGGAGEAAIAELANREA